MSHKHNHKHKKCDCFCDRPRKFHDKIGKGSIDSTPIATPPDFNTETGSSLGHITSPDNPHPGPFAAAGFHPSEQQFYGLAPRRHTPNKPPEKAGKVLMDDKHHGCDRFYRPRAKVVNSNFVKDALKKASHNH